MPIVDLGRDTTLCEGNSLSLDATNANASYAWEDGSQDPVQRVSGPGLYYVTVNLNGCVRKDSVLVNLRLRLDVILVFARGNQLLWSRPSATFPLYGRTVLICVITP